jgi:hypothetical protein
VLRNGNPIQPPVLHHSHNLLHNLQGRV